MPRKPAPKKPKKVLAPWDGYYDADQVRMREEIMEIVRRDNEWRLAGFVQFVIEKGYGAMTPPDKYGRQRTWQQVGADLFGKEAFVNALTAELARRRAARTSSRSERSPASSSFAPPSCSSSGSSPPPADAYSP
jgi:hypothetical protein